MISRLILVLAGVGLVGFGLAAIIDPIALWSAFGLPAVEDPAVRIELRAFYGGLEIGLGGWMLAHASAPDKVRTGLWLAVVVYGSLAAGRGLGMVIDTAGGYVWGAFVTELLLALLGGVALVLERRT